MNKNYFKNLNYRIYFIILIFFFSKINFAFSESINEIKIFGNERLSKETIVLFSEIEVDKDLNVNDLNAAIKKLYQTDYFENINIIIEDEILKITVVENPIIQTITINGVKNKSILNKLKEITKKSEKYPFLTHKISEQKNLLTNIVRSKMENAIEIHVPLIVDIGIGNDWLEAH